MVSIAVSNEEFRLKWDNSNSILQELKSSLYDNCDNCFGDCTIGADGKYLRAHKIVLSACSPYLQSIFLEHSDQQPMILLQDVSFKELKCMIDYMYIGEINTISKCELPSFLEAARSLKIKGLAEDTKDYDGASGSEHQKRGTVTEKAPTLEPVIIEYATSECKLPMFPRAAKSSKNRRLGEDNKEYHNTSDSEHHKLDALTENERTVELDIIIRDNEDPTCENSAPESSFRSTSSTCVIKRNFRIHQRKSPNDHTISSKTKNDAGNIANNSNTVTSSNIPKIGENNPSIEEESNEKNAYPVDALEPKNRTEVEEDPLNADDGKMYCEVRIARFFDDKSEVNENLWKPPELKKRRVQPRRQTKDRVKFASFPKKSLPKRKLISRNTVISHQTI